MKLDIKKIKKFISRILVIIAQHIFLSCLVLFLLSLLMGGVLFYRYGVLPQKIKPGVFKTFKLNEGIYQKALRVWQEEEQKFKQADTKEFFNPFQKKEKVEEAELTK